MRIAFLNSCLEPGRDGVGDYVRLLAEECGRQGHECCTIALHDQYVSEMRSDNPTHLRLPTHLPWPERTKAAQEILTRFAPDWISLQFVPYAFQPKGLVYGLGRHFLPLVCNRQTQIMFHEIWIGSAKGSSAKHRIIGVAQKRLVLLFVKQLKPNIIHTSNDAYCAVLRRSGLKAFPLPLFGNIPVSAENSGQWLLEELNKVGINITKTNRSDFWLVGFFGSLHPAWPPEPLLTQLRDGAARQSRQIILLSFGRLGPGEIFWDGLERQYSPSILFYKLGEQPAAKVSQCLNSLDFGVATSPYSLIGKSGTVAAMLDHGLPVIVNRNDSMISGITSDAENDENLLHRLGDHLADQIAGWKRRPPNPRLSHIAERFISSLKQF